MPAGSDTTLERLMDGAQATFVERGYGAANIHEICARAKVGIGTFYAHFEHKRQLLQRVFVERAVLLSSSLGADDLLDHDRLVACLRRANDDPVAAGLLRAWYEAVLDEPEIAQFHAEWRPSTLEVLAATIAEAQRRSPSAGPRHDPAVVAWAMATLSREIAIHDRTGAPDVDVLASLFEGMMFARVGRSAQRGPSSAP
jgi:AcrR family transcriptional regulator